MPRGTGEQRNMDISSISYIKGVLLTLPLSYAMITIFIGGCAIAGACILAYVAVCSVPDALRDFRAFRLERSAVIDTQPVWIKGTDLPGRRD
jgi:hypothetical protein